jgi:DNA-binding YbaB/EbfC family protein
MPDFLKIMQQMGQMQSRLKQLHEDLQKMTLTASTGGGMVTVEVNGQGHVRRVSIDPSVVNPTDVEMLEDLVLAAVAEAQKKATEASQAAMRDMTGGIDLPFPFQIPTT